MGGGRPRRSTHGDSGYARRFKCECEPCVEARRRYSRHLSYDQARGHSRRIRVDEVRAHLEQLLEGGAQRYQICSATGLADSVLKNILGLQAKPSAKWVLRPTAEKIMAATLRDVLAQPRLVDPIGARRRLQALQYMGHSCKAIGVEMGVTESMVYTYLRNDQIWSTTLDRIDGAYRRLSLVRGPSEFARWKAYREGWHPPLSWDDIDDPDAVPSPSICIVGLCSRPATQNSLCINHRRAVVNAGGFKYRTANFKLVVDRLSEGRVLDRGRLRREVAELLEEGLGARSIADRLNRPLDTIQKLLKEDAA